MSRLEYLKEEENTLRSFLSKIQTQLDALSVEELALKSRIRRKQERLAKESNQSTVNVNTSQSHLLKQPMQDEPMAADLGHINNELLDLEVASMFINKKEKKEEVEEEESDAEDGQDDQMTAFIKMMSNR